MAMKIILLFIKQSHASSEIKIFNSESTTQMTGNQSQTDLFEVQLSMLGVLSDIFYLS